MPYCFLFLLLLPSLLFANPWNHESTIIGERIFGMGGTGIALGNEIASCYYNPAGLISASGSSITMAGNLYSRIDIALTERKTFFQSLRDQISQGGFITLPAAWGGAMKRRKWAIGFYVFIPDSFDYLGSYNIDSTNGVSTKSTYQGKDQTSWYGVTWAMQLSDLISAGASLSYISRSYNESTTVSSVREENTTDVTEIILSRDLSSNSFSGTLGSQFRFENGFAFGAVFRLPNIVLGGNGRIFRNEIRTINGILQDVDQGYIDSTSMKAKSVLPMKIGFGLAYERVRDYAIEFDVTIYPAYKYNDLESSNEVISRLIHGNTVANYRLGWEYYFMARWSARGGFFTNLTSADKLDHASREFQGTRINLKGFSGTITYEGDRASLSFGGNYQGGIGEGVVLNSDGLYTVMPRSEYYYTFMLSSTYHF